MANIGEVLQVANYQGQAAAGGDFAPAIDLKSGSDGIGKLAEFTYYQNHSLWEKKVKDDNAAALKMAEMIALDPTTTIDQQRNPLLKLKDELSAYITDNPNSLYYDKDPKAWMKREELTNKFLQSSQYAKANDIRVQQYRDAIQQEPDVDKKQALQELLNRSIGNHFGSNPAKSLVEKGLIPPLDKVTPDNFKLPDVTGVQFKTTKKNTNDNTIVELTINDMQKAYSASIAAESDYLKNGNVTMEQEIANPVTEADRKKNEQIRYNNETKKLRQRAGLETSGLNQVVDKFNNYGAKYIAEKAQYDQWAKLPEDQRAGMPAPVVSDPLKIGNEIDAFNKIADQYDAAMTLMRQTDPNIPVAAKAPRINLNDGLSVAELIYMRSVVKDADKFIAFSETRQQTNEGIAKGNLALDWSKLAWEKKKSTPPPKGVDTTDPNYNGNVLYGVNHDAGGGVKVINGVIYGADGKISKLNIDVNIPVSEVNASVKTAYDGLQSKKGVDNKVQILAPEEGDQKGKQFIRYRFKNGIAIGVLTTNNQFADVKEFEKATDNLTQMGETKYKTETQVGQEMGDGSNFIPQAKPQPASTGNKWDKYASK